MTVINLNRAKKAAMAKTAKVQADANAVKFGLTKAEKLAQKKRAEKAARDLEGNAR